MTFHAFPRPAVWDERHGEYSDEGDDGMTLLDYFAGKALEQLSNTGRPAEEVARNCYVLGVAMLKAKQECNPELTPEDALLYAASPDLLESLRDVLSLIDRGLLVRDINMWNVESSSRLVAILSKAERSVAKAEGKA